MPIWRSQENIRSELRIKNVPYMQSKYSHATAVIPPNNHGRFNHRLIGL